MLFSLRIVVDTSLKNIWDILNPDWFSDPVSGSCRCNPGDSDSQLKMSGLGWARAFLTGIEHQLVHHCAETTQKLPETGKWNCLLLNHPIPEE